ncbi:MAG: peptide chain release factor 1 [Clostridia bacterium]|nr:peptide chain release factor 1 [Clostridia bacterium]
MLSKLREAEAKYEHLEASLSNPSVMADTDRYVAVMKEYKSLTPIIEKYRAYVAAEEAYEEALAILSDSSDPELCALADEQLKDAKTQTEQLYREFTVLLLPRDPNDEKNVIVEIRAGAGGEEAALFAAVLYRMYTMYATAEGFSCTVMNQNPTELGGYREIVFQVEGDGAYSRFKFESGVHRVQRVPETESQGRIQTSTATVAVLPEVEAVSVDLNPADIIMETCKSSGAGGQHINKTESAVRLIHKPTGIVVECQQERSQFKNKDKAMKMLASILYDRKLREQTEQIASDRQKQVGTGDRSERIRTYNYPQGRITDHRISLTLYSLDRFLDGDIGGMIDALATADTAEKLKAQAQ